MSDDVAAADLQEQSAAGDETGDDMLQRFQDWYRTDHDHSAEWRQEAREAYDFVAGRQWSDADLSMLQERNRPAITFNRIGPMLKIVAGLEVGNRQEIRYIPREIGDVQVNELLTEADRWLRDECNAEDEESDAFVDMAVTGMGWTDTTIEYDENPDGKLVISRLDPIEMGWDSSAVGKNLSDARRAWRTRDVPRDDARTMYPDADESDLNAGWADDLSASGRDQHDPPEPWIVRSDPSHKRDREMVRLVELQYWELVTVWRIAEADGQGTTLSGQEWATLRERFAIMGLPEPYAVRQRVRKYKRAIIGASILEQWDGPKKGGFTWKCMTADRDRNRGTWFGVVRAMLDPQRWANKWLSQSLHILNSGAKGGIIAETDAFDSVRDAEDDWAEPDAIVFATPGAVSGRKIMERPGNQMPQAMPDLLQLAISSIRDCTGINLELLGLVERDQPGIVETARKQAGMTVLAGLFDSLRRYRKEQGRLMLWYITTFLSDGRLIRVGGQSSAKYLPLVRQEGTIEYDVIVDDTPTSPNIKERSWATLVQMMPYLSKMPIPPQLYVEFLKFSPLSETITSKIASIIENQPQRDDPLEMAARGQMELDGARGRLAEAQAQKLMIDTALGQQKIQADTQKAQLEAVKTALSVDEIRAKIESLRARAMKDLSDAGAVQQDARTNQLLAVLDLLDGVVNWDQSARQMQPPPMGMANAVAM